jgi:hypothetical protein
MPKYKKSIVVSAELYQPGMEDGIVIAAGAQPSNKPFIVSSEGATFISPGDWIITEANGERYVCKPDVFKTYELVEEGTL